MHLYEIGLYRWESHGDRWSELRNVVHSSHQHFADIFCPKFTAKLNLKLQYLSSKLVLNQKDKPNLNGHWICTIFMLKTPLLSKLHLAARIRFPRVSETEGT